MTDTRPRDAGPALPQVRVRLPTTFAVHADGQRALALEADTVGHCLRVLIARHPGLAPLIWLNDRTLNPVIMIFHNAALIRDDSLGTLLVDGDTVDVVPAVESG